MVKQNILLSNVNKSNVYDLNNDVTLFFPSNLFFKPPVSIELINFDLKHELILFGNSNNTILISYTDNSGELQKYNIIVDFTSQIKSDYDLAIAVQTALNDQVYDNYSIVFTVTQSSIGNVVTNYKPDVDASTAAFTIQANNIFNISFDHKDSIGTLMGFGSGVYNNTNRVDGTSTQSISTYNYVDMYNESGNTYEFPNYNDYNCKMTLFDSNGDVIDNIDHPGLDITISINWNVGLTSYDAIGKVLQVIETEMNRYNNSFTPIANFIVSYDYITHQVTISNVTGAHFGIGFDFQNIYNGSKDSTGSLHFILGFEQRSYINVISITSTKQSLTYENSFADDYLLFCSDISNNSSDVNLIGIGSGDNVKSNDILFAIPLVNASHFYPPNGDAYKINIGSSAFSLGYKNQVYNNENPCLVNFYLRTLSGRHILNNCQWSSLISFTF